LPCVLTNKLGQRSVGEGRFNMPKTTKETPRRKKMIGVKVTEAEYETVRRLAYEAHRSLGAYMRDLVFAATKKPAK